MDRRKRYRQTVALMSMLSETKTIDNVDTATFDGNGENLLSLVVGIDPVQSGSGDPSPENIRPITGWTACNISHSGADTSDPTIYTIAFPSEAGTVYGGTLDVVRKKLTVDRAMVIYNGTEPWTYAADYHCVLCGRNISDIKIEVAPVDYQNNYGLVCHRPSRSSKQMQVGSATSPIETVATSADEWKALLQENSLQIVYNLSTPIVYDLADVPTIQTFAGENNIWADTGKIIFLEYEA